MEGAMPRTNLWSHSVPRVELAQRSREARVRLEAIPAPSASPEEWEARAVSQLEADIESYRVRIKTLLQEKNAIASEKEKLAAQLASAPVVASLLNALAGSDDLPACLNEGKLHKFPHRMGLACCKQVIVRLRLLQHAPHSIGIVACVAPIAFRVKIAKKELRL